MQDRKVEDLEAERQRLIAEAGEILPPGVAETLEMMREIGITPDRTLQATKGWSLLHA